MADNPRIEELRRRVQKDPASIAFAQLAEEYRRAGRFQDAIETCRTGLAQHPGYVSAHVTLGRACVETGDLQTAEDELTGVLTTAPENLAALRGLAEIHHRRRELPKALSYYRRALDLARHDPDLEHLVAQIARELEPVRPPPAVPDGLSFDEAMGELLAFSARETGGSGPAPAADLGGKGSMVVPAAPAVDPDRTGPIPVPPQAVTGPSPVVPVQARAGRQVDDDQTTRLDDVTSKMPVPPPLSVSEPALASASVAVPVVALAVEPPAAPPLAVSESALASASVAAPAVPVPLEPPAAAALQVAPDPLPTPAAYCFPAPSLGSQEGAGPVGDGRAARQIKELERWLDAIRATRASNA